MSEISDATIRVPETKTYKVQELHLPIYHYLCEKNEEYFYSVYKNGNYYNTHMYLPLDKSDLINRFFGKDYKTFEEYSECEKSAKYEKVDIKRLISK